MLGSLSLFPVIGLEGEELVLPLGPQVPGLLARVCGFLSNNLPITSTRTDLAGTHDLL